MKTLRKVGVETGELTDEEIEYIDKQVVEAAMPRLVGRQLFPIFNLGHAGIFNVKTYKKTSMSQATIDIHGVTMVRDRVELEGSVIDIVDIHKEYKLYWRDVIASRHGGLPLETINAEDAARQVAEEEDKLLITGEYSGWRALGIEGLATATGRNTEASAGVWPDNSITDINDAIEELETDGHYGPYALILRSTWYRKLPRLIANTGIFYLEKIKQIVDWIFVSDSLYTSGGLLTNAIVAELSPKNFDLPMGQDITTHNAQDEDMNILGKVYEVLAPRIKQPTSICEITGLT